MLFTRQESRNMDSPCPSGGSKESNPKPGQRVFHESRITRHESRPLRFSSHDFPRFPGISHDFPAPPPPWERVRAPFGRCFPARCGAAWRGMGGRRPPRRQHCLWGFHQPRDTQHGFSLFLRRLQGEQPRARSTGFLRITRHESRITAFIRPPLPPSRCPRAVRRRSRRLRAASAAVDAKGHTAPDSTAKTPLICVGSCPFVVNEPMLRKGRVRYCIDPKSDSLHFSPRGEAKCVRGPSGRGASRLARVGVLAKSPPSRLGSRNTASPVHRPSDISSRAN